MSVDAVFVQDGDTFGATDLALGPWFPGALHGGAPAALLVHAINGHEVADGLRLARITYEFVRPVPLGELAVAVEVVRPGRRVTLLDASLSDSDGTEVTRARALLVRPSEVGVPAGGAPPFPGPEQGERNDWEGRQRRWVRHRRHGDPLRQGAVPGARRRDRLVSPAPPAGRRPAGSSAGEPGGGGGLRQRHRRRARLGRVHVHQPRPHALHRAPPVDEWVALEAQTRVEAGSVAVAESILWDRRGRIGHAIQSLVVGPRTPAT